MAEEDWDKLIDSLGVGPPIDDDDLPPPPPPPPPAASAAAARPPPPPVQPQPPMSGIGAAIAARNAANAQGIATQGRRDSNPPPPPPPKSAGGPPPPPAAAGRGPPPPPVSSSPPAPPPPQMNGHAASASSSPPAANGAGGHPSGAPRPSLLHVVGAAATGLWGLMSGSGAPDSNPLAPVMAELSNTYQPFPSSEELGARPELRRELSGIKVVVTTPKIKRRDRNSAQGFTTPNGLRSPGGAAAPGGPDDDEELWSETNQSSGNLKRVWLRFIEPKSGSSLYFNTVTNSAQGDRPHEYDGSDEDSDGDEDDDAYALDLPSSRAPGSMPPASQLGVPSARRSRAESIIHEEAWDENKASTGHRTPVTSPGGSTGGIDPRLLAGAAGRGSTSQGGAGTVPPSPMSSSAQPHSSGRNSDAAPSSSAQQEEFGPTDVLNAAQASAPKALVSLEGFLSSSTLYSKQLEQLLEASSAPAPAAGSAGASKVPQLSSELEARLRSLLLSLQEIQTLLDVGGAGGGANGGQGSDVEQLVMLDKLPWDFSASNKLVQQYRRNVSEIAHERFQYNSWHLPAYLSTFPLPPDTKAVTIVVKLPDFGSADGSSAATTRIGVTEKDSCSAAIAQAFKKCADRLQGADKSLSVADFVLKGNGIADFMYGDDRRIMDYEYIRMCVRNGEEVKLSLVRRPSPTAEPENVKDFVPAYLAKVDQSYTTLDVNAAYQSVTARDLKVIPMCELTHLPFRFKLLGLDNFSEGSMPRFETVSNLYVRMFLFYGCKNVAEPRESESVEIASDPRWLQWVVYKDLTLASVPRGARIGFILCGKKIAKPEKEIMLGWVVHQLVDSQGQLSRGKMALRLWANEARKKGKHGKPREPDVTFLHRATTAMNLSTPLASVATLHIQLDDFCLPVVAPVSEKIREPAARVVGMEVPLKSLSKDQLRQFEGLLVCDLLKELSESDQILLWNCRHHLVKNPAALGKFLQCVDWGHVEKRMEAYRLLKIWAQPPSAVTALELLDAKFPDPIVREYGINLLRGLKDDELRNYLLQLVQCLKFEPYHDSPLKRFLIERALAAPMNVGHYFFWHLKAEVHAPMCCERFGLVLEEYLSFAGRFTIELRKQSAAVLKLQRVAEMVVRLKRDHGYSDPDAMKEYTKECEKLNRDFFTPMGKFQLPLDPKIEVTTLVVEKCRYMSSKMVPLWLVFKNADPDAPNVYVIFKSGDDLRQDILTLQILTLMDALWLSSGLDAKMKPYKCIATGVNEHGEGVGLIEVVLNSDTTSGIQLKYGGGAMGALKMDPLDRFLLDHNKISKDYEKAVDNFVCSCAGYCVATFVLGIGDRHNGNIMVTKDGHLFHIDFGHFLGNFKQKFGINRERAAFVFTPEMAFVMGGAKYRSSSHFKKFLDYCSRAFKTLRVHANLLESLFGLMVAAGMPELMKETDIYYMRDKLLLNEKESKASQKLNEEIENSLDSKYRRFDNFIHNMRHG